MEYWEKFRDFMTKWYAEGIRTSPPPCLMSRTFRKTFSDNTACGPVSCYSVGQWGLKWGAKHRSPIMFVAFWLSFISLILLIVPFASLSYNAGTVRQCAWTIGRMEHTKASADSRLFIGLRMFVVTCDGGSCNDAQYTQHWDSTDCTGDYCNYCQDSCDSTVSTAFMSLFTMLPQLTTNLQRSTPGGDLNCQKWMALFTGVLGVVSTIASLVVYKGGCYDYLPTEIEGISYDFHLGPSFYCMLVATILKGFDFIFNLLVPVPLEGNWDPDRDQQGQFLPVTENASGSKKESLLEADYSYGNSMMDGSSNNGNSNIGSTAQTTDNSSIMVESPMQA